MANKVEKSCRRGGVHLSGLHVAAAKQINVIHSKTKRLKSESKELPLLLSVCLIPPL